MIKIVNKVYFTHQENRMKNEGDVQKSINYLKTSNNSNLKFLLSNRYDWMKKFIKNHHHGIEIGAGAGFSKIYLKYKNFKISDIHNYDHLDIKNLDAYNTMFKDQELDYVIESNVIHHLSYPLKCIKEVHRILKPNGLFIIQDLNCSFFLQLITIIMKHEGFDFTSDVWNEDKSAIREDDPWSANEAIPNLLFDDRDKFEKHLGNLFEIKFFRRTEFLTLINSGGVISKTKYIPLPKILLVFFKKIDEFLIKLFPSIFAMQMQIVLRKK